MSKETTEQVAILGGGIGSLVAAFELTNRPEDRSRFDLTVYQVGWRLGGKAASGRNPAAHDRIEEHGIHVFLGFYENAFRVMRLCFEELGRPEDAILSRCFEGPYPAFRPHDDVTLMEPFQGGWHRWELPFPSKPGLPGDEALARNGTQLDGGMADWDPWNLFLDLGRWLVADYDRNVKSVPFLQSAQVTPLQMPVEVRSAAQKRFAESGAAFPSTRLHAALMLAEGIGPFLNLGAFGQLKIISLLLDGFVDDLEAGSPRVQTSFAGHQARVTLRLGAAILRGMIVDRIVLRGFDAVNDSDLLAWLRKHGAREREIWWSAIMRMFYDLVLGYEPEDTSIPNLAAGTGLRGMLRTLLRYRGHVAWKMQAGMGDVVIAPLYEVLKSRGVKFAFFHRVDELQLSLDRTRIEHIRMGVQAKTEGGEAYEPLHPFPENETGKTVLGWPSAPRVDQLDFTPDERAELETLRRRGVDPFESAWSPWPDRDTITLNRGEHFDHVVLGISVGALGRICAPLVEANPKWERMVRKVKTIQSQSFQLWLNKNWSELGWESRTVSDAIFDVTPAREEPFVGTYELPHSTWVGMSQLIPRENFPSGAVKHIAYFYGVLQDQDRIPAPGPDADFAEGEGIRVRDGAIAFLEQFMAVLWPEAFDQNGFRWDLLVGPDPGNGRHPFESQYWRANVNPSDRYVLSQRGSPQHRLAADESGFENLYLAGDWVRTGLDAGCAEAATMAGMQAARALSGTPVEVIGESDFRSPGWTEALAELLGVTVDAQAGLVAAAAAALQGMRDELQTGTERGAADDALVRGVLEGAARFFGELAGTAGKLHEDLRERSGSRSGAEGENRSGDDVQTKLKRLIEDWISQELERIDRSR